MRNKLFTLFILLSPIAAFCADWVKISIDSLATIEMPAYPNIRLSKPNHVYGLKTDTVGFMVMYQLFDNSGMPKTQQGLEDSYNSILKGLLAAANKKAGKMSMVLESKTIVQYEGMKCLEAQLNVKDTVSHTMLYRIFLIKDHCVMILTTYKSNESMKYKEEKDKFFNSLNFNNNVSARDQYKVYRMEDTWSYKLGQILGMILFWGFIIWLGYKLIQYYKWKY